jgi:glycosyltransferase involved in cell wall biosynthesis
LRAYIRWSLKGTSAAVVEAEALAPMFTGLIPRSRICAVPNGIDGMPEEMRRSGVQAGSTRVAGTPSGVQEGDAWPPTVLYVGTLIESKGFLDVMAAAPAVAREVPGARFVVVGDYFQPSDREKSERLLQDPAIRATVELPGVVTGNALYELMQQADVFVFPSYYPVEGQPIVLLMAMSAGLPVITTDHGAIRETIAPDETGYLVPKQDPAAIAQRVVQLLRDERERVRMGEAGRRRFEERYRLEEYWRGMARVFDQVLGVKQP